METAEKPTAAFVLSLIGGIFILIGGIIMTLASVFIGGLGLICGVLVVVGAVMLYVNPESNVPWGVIILVFSVISLFFAFLGGFVVGMILGITGGALGIAWKPSPPPAPTPTPITKLRKSLIGAIVGILILVVGCGLIIALPASAPWKTRIDDIAEGEVLEISWPFTADYYCPYFFFHIYGGETKDWTVSGTAVEAEGRAFNFYVFDKTNFDLWKGGATNVEAYVSLKDVTTTNFQFSINSGEDVSNLYFVAEQLSLNMSENRLVTVSATVQWQEKQTLGFAILGFLIGGILAVAGLVMALVCGIYALTTKEKKAPLKPEITRVCPQCGRVLTEEVKFCPHCGKALE